MIACDGVGWTFSAEDVLSSAATRWPGMTVARPPDPTYSHTAELTAVEGQATTRLSDDGTMIEVEGSPVDAADVIAWYRSLVPATQPLVLVDEATSYEVEVALVAGHAAEDVLKAIEDQ